MISEQTNEGPVFYIAATLHEKYSKIAKIDAIDEQLRRYARDSIILIKISKIQISF